MANIFAQFARPVRSVADYSADMDRADSNALVLAANKMKAQQDQQAVADEQGYRSAFSESGGDQNKLRAILIGRGLYRGVQALDTADLAKRKGQSELDTAEAVRRKTAAETIDKSLQNAKQFVPGISTPQQAQAYLQGLYSDPVLGEIAKRMMPMEQAMQQVPQDEAGLLKWKTGHMSITGDKLVELLMPKTDSTALGGRQSFGSTDRFTGQRTETGSAPITESANNIANNERIKAEGAAGRAVQVRGQNMVDARSKDANNNSKALIDQERQLKIDALQEKAAATQRAKQAGVSSVENQIGVIDKALKHPGRETATGFSGSADPRNYIPGTDAADFRAVLDQIGGAAFLQAFESLKGGGQITEVEGKKATDAIARLNRAQSDKEFKTSLDDLRTVMTTGYKRLSGKDYQEPNSNQGGGKVSNAKGWKLHTDAKGNRAYVSPDGKQFEEAP